VGWYRTLRCLLGRLERHCGQVRFVRTLKDAFHCPGLTTCNVPSCV
jgi:hypothetical protein